jgi:hypothetical protein
MNPNLATSAGLLPELRCCLPAFEILPPDRVALVFLPVHFRPVELLQGLVLLARVVGKFIGPCSNSTVKAKVAARKIANQNSMRMRPMVEELVSG